MYELVNVLDATYGSPVAGNVAPEKSSVLTETTSSQNSVYDDAAVATIQNPFQGESSDVQQDIYDTNDANCSLQVIKDSIEKVQERCQQMKEAVEEVADGRYPSSQYPGQEEADKALQGQANVEPERALQLLKETIANLSG